jgi:diguanylate cyclase (GGDEF)-like protein
MATLQKKYDELLKKYNKLKEEKEIAQAALDLTDHVISVIDIPNHTLFKFQKENENLLKAPHITDVPYSIVALGIIHPDDCENYINLFKEFYGGSPSGKLALRIKTIDKGWNWYMFYYKTIFDMNKTPIKAISFLEDINDQKTAEEQFEQYKKAVNEGNHLTWEANLSKNEVISYDAHTDRIIKNKKSYSELLKGAFSLFANVNITEELAQLFARDKLIETYKRGEKEVTYQFKFEDKRTNEISWYRATAYLTSQEEDIFVIMSIIDTTKHVDEHLKLEKKAEQDYLTGLLNRETVQERINYILNDDGLHAMIMADIDNFKFYNDQHGHIFGDEIIKYVAQSMKETFRTSDIIGRIGGDEFVIFMKDVRSQDDVLSRLGHLQKRLIEITHEHIKGKDVTLSLGVTLSSKDDTFLSMYKRADEALYQSKKDGKNCIRFHLLQS